MLLLKLACVFLCGYMNRGRGSSEFLFPKVLDYLCLGMLLTFLLNVPLYWAIILPIATVIGYGEPWGKAVYQTPMAGSKFEWWMKHGLFDKDDSLIALLQLGVMNAIVLIPMVYFHQHTIFYVLLQVFVPAIAATLASLTVHGEKWPWFLPTINHNKWEKGEYMWGWGYGVMALSTTLGGVV